MENSEIITLRNKYRTSSSPSPTSIKKLYDYYIRQREKALLDSITASAALAGVLYSDHVDLSQITPQMEEAFHMAFPQKSLESIQEMDTEQLEGLVSAWKGKYFEVMVRDDLNQGEWVGDLHLEQGQSAVLADSLTQPGWDLQIMNGDGTVAEELSLKATDSLAYVKTALERYPDIHVLATDEVVNNADAVSDQILASGIMNNDLEQAISSPMASLIDSPAENLMEAVLPGLPFVIIALAEGRHVLMGRRSFEQFLPVFMKRAAKTGIAMGAGFLSTFIIPDVFSILVTVGVRMMMSRGERMENSIKYIDRKTELITPLAVRYNPSH
jgi:hypothetical protein